LADNRIS